jgi:hypothetical protein
MSVQPALPAGRALERLFTPGIRLGWTFRDRHGLTAPYPEPQPDPDKLRKQTAERAAAAQARYARARRWVIKPSLAFGLLLLLLAGYAEGKNNTTDGATTLAAAVIVTVSGWDTPSGPGGDAAGQPPPNPSRPTTRRWKPGSSGHPITSRLS